MTVAEENRAAPRLIPLPTRPTTEAVRLRIVEAMSWPEIEQAVGLSHRKLNYILLAIAYDDLGWAAKPGTLLPASCFPSAEPTRFRIAAEITGWPIITPHPRGSWRKR
jgi:hypothetical protein